MICTDTEVCGFLAFGNGEGMKEGDGVVTLTGSVSFAAAIKETTDLSCVGLLPSILAGSLA